MTGVMYVKSSQCGASCTWLYDGGRFDVHGQRTYGISYNHSQVLSIEDYAYDKLGRLRETVETVAGQCTGRTYSYDANSNRTKVTTRPPTSSGACQPNVAGIDETTSVDAADRIDDSGFTYDGFGRTLTVPAAKAGGQQLTSTFFVDDRLKSASQAGLTREYALDPARRTATRITSGTSAATETYHYADDSDSPSWIALSQDGTSYERQIVGIDGDLVATRTAAATRLQLTNLHGDVLAEASSNPATTALLRSHTSSDFGVPRGAATERNEWLGGKRRSNELPSGVVAMGQRSYVPQLGRFLQVDPVLGGAATDYDYAMQDPLNTYDLDGRSVFDEIVNNWVKPCLVGGLRKKLPVPKIIKGGGCIPGVLVHNLIKRPSRAAFSLARRAVRAAVRHFCRDLTPSARRRQTLCR